jgi:hypothetical protein
MSDGLQEMRDNLAANPAARARFVADLLGMLERQGVNVNDTAVLNSLDLNLDLRDGQAFVDGTLASSAVITITA